MRCLRLITVVLQSGINREFAGTTDQSCLNHWITEVDWDEKALNQRRLDLLQQDSSTRYTKNGVTHAVRTVSVALAYEAVAAGERRQ